MFRTALMPPKTTGEAVTVMRAAFVELWKDQNFIRDYAKVVKIDLILVSGEDAQDRGGTRQHQTRDQDVLSTTAASW
jgi:hypothetical protein